MEWDEEPPKESEVDLEASRKLNFSREVVGDNTFRNKRWGGIGSQQLMGKELLKLMEIELKEGFGGIYLL